MSRAVRSKISRSDDIGHLQRNLGLEGAPSAARIQASEVGAIECYWTDSKLWDHERKKSGRLDDRKFIIGHRVKRVPRVRVNLDPDLALTVRQTREGPIEPDRIDTVATAPCPVVRVQDLVDQTWLRNRPRPVDDTLLSTVTT
jgi:hypothetical protein